MKVAGSESFAQEVCVELFQVSSEVFEALACVVSSEGFSTVYAEKCTWRAVAVGCVEGRNGSGEAGFEIFFFIEIIEICVAVVLSVDFEVHKCTFECFGEGMLVEAGVGD